MEGKASGSWARAGLEKRESQAIPLPLFDEGLQIPPPDPDWKQELNQKLEDYRSRRESRRGKEKAFTAQAQGSPNSGTGLKENVLQFGRSSGATSSSALRNELKKALHTRQVDPEWRKVERPVALQKLPPLRKPEVAASPETPIVAATPPAGVREEAPESMIQRLVAPLAMRAVAALLDFVLVLVALGVFVAVFYLFGGPVMTDPDGLRALAFAFFAITGFYWVFYIRYIGETAGMTWVGLRLVSFDGGPPTEGQRRTRAFGTILSTAAAGIGFAWSVADDEQLTWHDRMSKTFVVREESRLEGQSSPRASTDRSPSNSSHRPLPPLRPIGNTGRQ
jgi:uncharacterized RDD family membrane protein YckC